MIVASSVDQSSRFSLLNRWRMRFSLRTLLLSTTILCVWLGLSFSSARRQQRAVEAIEAAGGSVGYEHNFDYEAGYWRGGEPVGPEWLRSIIGHHFFDTVIDVRFSKNEMKNTGRRFADVGPYLGDLPHLRHLSLSGIEMSDDEFAMVATHANPEELICGMMEISDQEAAQLSAASGLRELGLNSVIISAQGVAEFKKLPQLESFWIVCQTMEYGPAGQVISHWVEKYKLGDAVVASFLEFPKLRRLSLNATLISDDGVEVLSRLDGLESFEISSPNITNAAMQDVVKLKNLTWLSIGGTRIGDETLHRLHELPKLKGLRLSAAVTNAGLPIVAQLKQLESLDLGGKQIDDRGLSDLVGMKNLKKLDVQSTAVTTDGPAVKKLQRALPNCYIHQFYPSPSFR